jgi:predicted permease
MKNRRVLFVVLLSSFAFLLLYIAGGFVLWRLGFLPRDQSFMERVVTVVFLTMMCLSPLGILSSVSTNRAAKKQAALHNAWKVSELRLRTLKSLATGLLDCTLGGVGYYLVTRRVFPQIDVLWIFTALIIPMGLIQIVFNLKLNSMREHQSRNESVEPHPPSRLTSN